MNVAVGFIIVCVIILPAVGVLALLYKVAQAGARGDTARRYLAGRRAEQRAEALLAEQGTSILGKGQPNVGAWMWVGLLQDSLEVGRRVRAKVSMDGDGVRFPRPVLLPDPDVDYDTVGVWDRSLGGRVMEQLSADVHAETLSDGTVRVGAPFPIDNDPDLW